MTRLGRAFCGVAVACVTAPSAVVARQHQSAPKEAASSLAAGWTGIADVSGRCYYSVPSEWRIDDADRRNAVTASPDGFATVQQAWRAESSWSAFTLRTRLVLMLREVHDDSARRFWVEYDSGWPGTHHFVAVPAADGVCVTYLDVRARGANQLRAAINRIVATIAALD